MKALMIILLISCGSTHKPPPVEMPEWSGKSRDEVKAAFSHLTPKTEKNKISYRDSDPIPSPARCAVIPCWPFMGQGISCRYVFKFENEKVVKATKDGRCRQDDKRD